MTVIGVLQASKYSRAVSRDNLAISRWATRQNSEKEELEESPDR